MAFMSELAESLNQLDIVYSSRESDDDFIKFALEKAVIQKKTLPPIDDNSPGKNDIISQVKFQLATQLFRNPSARLIEIVGTFNQAMAYASSSELLARIYVNRSALLMNIGMYEESLKDVNLAIKAKYPKHLIAIVYMRKAKLLFALSRLTEVEINLKIVKKLLAEIEVENEDAVREDMRKYYEQLTKYRKIDPQGTSKVTDVFPDLFKLHTPQRDNSVFLPSRQMIESSCSPLSAKVNMCFNPSSGFFLGAKVDIDAGEPIFQSGVYSSVINSDHRYLRCWKCTKFCWSCVPCESCPHVVFCSENCRDMALILYHDIECPVIRVLLKHRHFYDNKSLMSLRIFIRAIKECSDLEGLEKYIAKAKIGEMKYDFFQYHSIFYMSRYPVTRERKDKYSFVSIYYLYCLAAATKVFGKEIRDIQELQSNKFALFVGKLLFHHLMIVDINMIPLKQIALYDSPRIYGGAICPAVCLQNHNDPPNSYQFFSCDKIVISTTQRIKKGETIIPSYGPNYLQLLSDEQRDVFLKQEHFWNNYKSSFADFLKIPYPSCLNHFEIPDDFNEIRECCQDISILNLIHWSSDRFEESPCDQIMYAINTIVEFMNYHDKTKTQPCIKIEALRWLLFNIYDFIDCYDI